ncbi:FAD-binding protein [Rhodococcus sp. IEGM 1379]|uniref:FAD-binding protein n=1 Tax=Rhodococcus sp. IEGM 1379 TaxID=3047086 RepID=UPI0024B78F93|nr:FAD-binding protein [Rhodococcus sp. IEGM 1379]MDI9914071.1 FAD-binding protein [Rhodococcus sp. IEGM 1379]
MADEQYDVVVVGSGGGGLCAAYTAAREGLRTLLIESTSVFGGTTAYSGGGMWFPTNAVLRRAGDDDTLDDARTYFQAVVGDRTPKDLQESYLCTGSTLIDYLEIDDAFAFEVLPWPDYFGDAPKARAGGRHIIPAPLDAEALGDLRLILRPPLGTDRLGLPLPSQITGGQALIGRFLLAAQAAGVTLRANTEFRDYLVEDGAVVGVVVSVEGDTRTIRATRGVIIAAGGFEQSAEMRTRFGVPGVVESSMGAPANTGLPIRAGIDIGADVDLMGEAWWSPGLTHPDGRSAFSLCFTGGVFVDVAGRRFVNESAPYDRLGREVITAMDDGTVTLPFWMIYDDREGLVPPVKASTQPMVEPDAYVDAGLWHTADTLAELAQKIGVDADTLEATVKRFNMFADSGVDEDFGRGSEPYDRAFTGGKSPMAPITKSPFHAAAFGLSDLGTKGGLRTDPNARVLDADSRVISGLYAAGNSMAAVSGTVYPGGGNPIGASMVFGFLAAKDARSR